MMKPTFFALALFICSTCFGQQWMTRNGNVEFFSATFVEDIEAQNEMVSGLLAADGRFAFRVPILGFRFEKALMEEHFNENYLESTQFPNGTFEGTIANWDPNFESGTWHDVIASGTLTVHGIEKNREISSKIMRDKDGWKIQSAFVIATADHEIPIPKMVRDKIAEEISVTVDLNLLPR
jgi:hypothetical protein